MKLTVAIPTNADWQRLEVTARSLIANTAEPQNVDVIFLDNKNTFGHDMLPWIQELRPTYRGDMDLVVMPKRAGLTTAWKWCTDMSFTDWTVITNDDIYFTPGWDTKLRKLIQEEPRFDIYLLCHPFNWSGFAVNKAFVKRFPWNLDFPAGYHEDNDLYLRVARAYDLTKKDEVYTRAIYCLPYNTTPPSYCFQHLSHEQTKVSEYYTRWDSDANRKVFESSWQAVAPDHPGAIENKNGTYFIEK